MYTTFCSTSHGLGVIDKDHHIQILLSSRKRIWPYLFVVLRGAQAMLKFMRYVLGER